MRIGCVWLAMMVSTMAGVKVVDGVKFHVVEAKPEQVRIVWKDVGGRQLRTFPEVAGFLKGKGQKVAMLMNGGIFDRGGVPSGLLIQEGKELRPVNRRKGEGNFYLEPNGVFYVTEAGAGVVRTDEWPVAGKVRCAVQSGPLLLRQGQVHPAFREASTSRLHRNGVGVRKDGTVVFAITDFHSPKFPNLYEFAMLFRGLGCDDALFLDGDISRMREGEAAADPSQAFGSFVAVVEER